MNRPAVPDVVIEAITRTRKVEEGFSFKLKHPFRLDGSVCTPDSKDPALTVTRGKNKWLFYCHRCGVSGIKDDRNMTPVETARKIKTKEAEHIEFKKVSLPSDFTLLTDLENFKAYGWLMKYDLYHKDIIKKYKIGWSDKFRRVILPVYEGKELVGWVGRELDYSNKETRQADGVSKYIMRTKQGKRRYFDTGGDSNTIIIVEDILSAIKVYESTGVRTIALLNCDVKEDLYDRLMDHYVLVWLDPDMKRKCIKTVNRLNQITEGAKIVSTDHDPKYYGRLHISDTINDKTRAWRKEQ